MDTTVINVNSEVGVEIDNLLTNVLAYLINEYNFKGGYYSRTVLILILI